MRNKTYHSLAEIKKDLQVLQLERKIHVEELKQTTYQFKRDVSPSAWIMTLLNSVKKYGTLVVLKKLIR